MDELVQEVRLDRWLWAARFFKMRSLATEAIRGGHVRINGERTKPAKTVKLGDRIVIVKSGQQFAVTVTGLADRRGPAAAAAVLFEESQASITARSEIAALRRYQADVAPAPAKRPDKRARRELKRVKESRG